MAESYPSRVRSPPPPSVRVWYPHCPELVPRPMAGHDGWWGWPLLSPTPWEQGVVLIKSRVGSGLVALSVCHTLTRPKPRTPAPPPHAHGHVCMDGPTHPPTRPPTHPLAHLGGSGQCRLLLRWSIKLSHPILTILPHVSRRKPCRHRLRMKTQEQQLTLEICNTRPLCCRGRWLRV